MDANQLKEIIQEQIADVETTITENSYLNSSATFMGQPVSDESIESTRDSIRLLKASLIEPILSPLVDAIAEDNWQKKKLARDFWFVCKGDMGYWVVYDEQAGEFGLASADDERNGEYIGVSGDIVGVFMAI